MTKEVIDNLHDVLKEKICTITKASLDKSNDCKMCNSNIKVVNFDKIPKIYSKLNHLSILPKSNDAIYITPENEWFFIEFKNGSIYKDDLYRKIYDSLIMLIEMKIIEDFQFSRDNINYILVYNAIKNDNIQESDNRNLIFSTFKALSNKESVLFGIEDFKGYLFKDSHTYTKEIFEQKFISKIEKIESVC